MFCMQKKRFRLLLLLCGLFSSLFSYAQVSPPCSLPAPTNIQFNQPTPFTLNVTWNAVPGAVAYLAILENLSGGGQQIAQPLVPSASFVVTPGHYYRFTVAAECSLNHPSSNKAMKEHQAESIIVDMIVDRATPCTPNGLPQTIGPGDSIVGLSSEQVYNVLIGGTSLANPPGFQLIFNSQEGWFEYKRLDPLEPEESVEGAPENSFQYEPPQVFATNVRASYPGSSNGGNISSLVHAYISFPTTSSIYLAPESSSGVTLSLYACQKNGAEGEGDRSTFHTTQSALYNIFPASPFESDMILYFQEHPEQALTAQLFDVNGRMQLQKTIQPDEMGENRYVLPTAILQPGVYFLRLETAPGVFATRKVVKM